ncbi:MAG: hypothetical protein IKY78_10200 [Clostridia bacterium]|nr:hypothetical protein [Clostridia bacterium]
MKKIIAMTLTAVLMLSLFAACGKTGEEMKDDVKEELTTIREDLSDALTEGKNDAEGIGDMLTENGNVTNQTSEGALQEALTDISEMLEGNGDREETTKKDTTR